MQHGVIAHRQRVGAGAGLGVAVDDYRIGNERQRRTGLDGVRTAAGYIELNRIETGYFIGIQYGLAQRTGATVVGVCDQKRRGIFKGADITECTLRTAGAALVNIVDGGRGTSSSVAGIYSRTAGQQGQGLGGAAIVGQGIQERIGVDEIAGISTTCSVAA